jgi:hypothetical protein
MCSHQACLRSVALKRFGKLEIFQRFLVFRVTHQQRTTNNGREGMKQKIGESASGKNDHGYG